MTRQSRCPLCLSGDCEPFHRDTVRDYLRCRNCLLVFVPPDWHLPPAQEKALYDLHQNANDDTGYRRFLSRLADPLIKRLPPGATGLDYGCGPGPTLAAMLSEQGFPTDLFDPFYANHPHRLTLRYDFVTCTEVVEHFRTPAADFRQLFTLLKPGGWLGIMTKQVIDAAAFAKWHYKNDPTHICFFSRATFDWLAELYACRVEYQGADVILLQRPLILSG